MHLTYMTFSCLYDTPHFCLYIQEREEVTNHGDLRRYTAWQLLAHSLESVSLSGVSCHSGNGLVRKPKYRGQQGNKITVILKCLDRSQSCYDFITKAEFTAMLPETSQLS